MEWLWEAVHRIRYNAMCMLAKYSKNLQKSRRMKGNIGKACTNGGIKWYGIHDDKTRYSAQKGDADLNRIEDVANFFLEKEEMTHKKLQKLCYYAVAWGYALTDKPIVVNPKFEAWRHGPVSPDLYSKYKGNSWKLLKPDKPVPNFDGTTLDLLESVWLTYGEETANGLEALSHSELPWKIARGGCSSDERCTVEISVSDMKRYYKSIYIGDEA